MAIVTRSWRLRSNSVIYTRIKIEVSRIRSARFSYTCFTARSDAGDQISSELASDRAFRCWWARHGLFFASCETWHLNVKRILSQYDQRMYTIRSVHAPILSRYRDHWTVSVMHGTQSYDSATQDTSIGFVPRLRSVCTSISCEFRDTGLGLCVARKQLSAFVVCTWHSTCPEPSRLPDRTLAHNSLPGIPSLIITEVGRVIALQRTTTIKSELLILLVKYKVMPPGVLGPWT